MKTLFAIDDDIDFLEEFRVALELYGYRVLTTSSPEEAVTLAKEIKPDCILFDLKMPKKHGFQIFEELKEDVTLKHIPTIAMSAFYKKDYDMYLSIFGIGVCLRKPFSPDTAIEAINSVLSRYKK